jgi:AcrR family transcriptional regulator
MLLLLPHRLYKETFLIGKHVGTGLSVPSFMRRAPEPGMTKLDRSCEVARRGVHGREALLAAAEEMYGCHGLDGVTIRQITLAAGMANNSAVSYHFGTKDGLLRAISEWRLPVIEAAAAAELDLVQANGAEHSAEALIGVLLRPYLAIRDARGRHPHARFMQQMLRSNEGRAIRRALLSVSLATATAFDLLQESLPHLPRPLLHYRMRIGSVAFFDGISEWDGPEKSLEFPDFTLDEVASELIGMVTANCQRPFAESSHAGPASLRG